MKKIIIILCLLLAGCASNGIPTIAGNDTPDHVVTHTKKMLIGVPLALSMEGSYVEIGNGYSLTAAHNWPIMKLTGRKYISNETQDIAIVNDGNNSKPVRLGLVATGQKIFHSGYPVGMPLAYSEGEYIGDVMTDDGMLSMSTAKNMFGMSGGGVWNEKGELVGITARIVYNVTTQTGEKLKNVTVFQSINAVKDWVKSNAGLSYE